MGQDFQTGYGSFQMPMRFGGFGAASTAVGFDNTFDMNAPLYQEHRAYPETFPSETPPDVSTDDSMSPRSHSSSIFELNDPIQGHSDMDFYDSLFFDSGSISMQNSMAHVLPGSSDLDYPDDNFKPFTSQHDLTSLGTSFTSSRPPTRKSLSFTTTSTRSGRNVSSLTSYSIDENVDESSSPTSSSSQYEGRDHPFYRRGMEADGLYHCPMEGCDFPPKALKCEYHKHIDSHLKPFRCRKPGCANQAFSSVACRLRHEREIHKMHNAEQFLCRYDGPCERKQVGNGFARSFNRGDHEKRVHQMFQEKPRSKGRPKATSSETSNTPSTLRRNSAQRKSILRDANCASDESSTTVGTIAPTSPKPRHQKHATPVNASMAVTSMDSYMVHAPNTNFETPLNTPVSMMQNQTETVPNFSGTKRTRLSKTNLKLTSRGASQASKRHAELVRLWFEHTRKLRNHALNLQDFPDDLSNNILQSINKETYELLRIHEVIRDMDDNEPRPSPRQSQYSMKGL